MQRNSTTINAITELLFVGKDERELSHYELAIFFGNNDIVGNAEVLKMLWDKKHITHSSTVILSGNVGLLDQGEEPESIRLFNKCVEIGIPESIFILEDKATNALENLKYSKPIAENIKSLEEFDGILFIGRAFMGRRALMGAAACGYPVDGITYFGTVDKKGKNIGPDSWFETDGATQRVLEELERISKYTLKGDIALY